jgi:hypothetical protein
MSPAELSKFVSTSSTFPTCQSARAWRLTSPLVQLGAGIHSAPPFTTTYPDRPRLYSLPHNLTHPASHISVDKSKGDLRLARSYHGPVPIHRAGPAGPDRYLHPSLPYTHLLCPTGSTLISSRRRAISRASTPLRLEMLLAPGDRAFQGQLQVLGGSPGGCRVLEGRHAESLSMSA